jgi:hypothetical protein
VFDVAQYNALIRRVNAHLDLSLVPYINKNGF